MQGEKYLAEKHQLKPFDIIHNFRNRKSDLQKPRRKVSACERYRPLPEFTMRTRKMTADLDIRPYLEGGMDFENAEEEELPAFPDHPANADEHSQFLLRNEDSLENGIPLSPGMDHDLNYNLSSNSQFSTYNKLEKALLGFNLEESMQEEHTDQ